MIQYSMQFYRTFDHRYIHPDINTGCTNTYQRGDLLHIPHQPQQLSSSYQISQPLDLLQSISMTLSDIQVQLSSIEEQNSERDSTLKRLEKDISDMKENKRPGNSLEETLKSKRCRKRPRGLSVRF